MNNILDSQIKAAQEVIESGAAGILRFLKEREGTEEAKFALRFLDWMKDQETHQHLWEVFHEVIDFSKTGFLPSFDSFLVNYFLDDSYFIVEWRRVVYDEDYNIIWNKDGSYKTELTTKDDPRAKPVVVSNNDGQANPKLLMEAMDFKLEAARRRELKDLELRQFLDEIDNEEQ